MERNDERIVAVLRELADLGHRIGERAGELARLTTEQGRASDVPQTPRKTSTAPRHRTARMSDCRPVAVVSRRGSRSRHATVPHRMPESLRSHPRRRLAIGPGLVSGIVHLIALLGLAMMYVTVEARPVRPVITLGEAAAMDDTSVMGEATETILDEVTLAASEAAQPPDDPMEALSVVEAMASEPFPVVEPPASAELFAEVQSADGVGVADVASFDRGDMLAEVGGGGQVGGRQGRGGAASPADATFFGRAGQARSLCFICDNSNSYRAGSFHAVLDELARTVDSLRPEQSFFVIFSSDAAYPLFHPAGANTLQPATQENKQKLRAWLGTVEMCSGGQGIHDAVRLAGALGADVVYLLSDGDLGANVVTRLEAADFGHAVVHTFGVQQSVIDRRTGRVDLDQLREQQGRNQNLISIATAHGGIFTSVTVPAPFATLEKLRPIPRNRSRGGVWGVKL